MDNPYCDLSPKYWLCIEHVRICGQLGQYHARWAMANLHSYFSYFIQVR